MYNFQIAQEPPKRSNLRIVYLVACVVIFATCLALGIYFGVLEPEPENECDIKDFRPRNQNQSKIINGEEAIPHSYPWIISLHYYNYGHICGGSIIGKRWILTAGHCVKKNEVKNGAYKIVTGLHNRNIYQYNDVYNVIAAYSDFNEYDIFSKDIALLKLNRDIVFNNNVAPIKLSVTDSNKLVDKCLVTAGWGSISKTFDQQLPNRLQQTYVRVINDEKKCKIENKWDKNFVFCVESSSKRPYSMTCSGDSGWIMNFFFFC